MQIDDININDLKPFKNNPRQHTEKQIKQIMASINEFGFINPILVDEKNVILAGHGRYMAAKELDLSKVPCYVQKGLTENQKQALVIADNKIAMNSTWDEDLLWDQIKKLNKDGFNLDLLAFEKMEILPMLDPNVVDDPLAEWKDMPSFDQENLMPERTVFVHFASQKDCEDFFKLLGRNLTEKTKFIWFPEQEEFTTRDRQYETD